MSPASRRAALVLALLLGAGAACRPRGSPRATSERVGARPARRAAGLSPLRSILALVAGSGDVGFRDGPFAEAQFSGPAGLAVSPDGNLLVVADREGNRLRSVRIAGDHRVETLAGNGVCGDIDGPLATTRFNLPTHVAFTGPSSLVVWDAGSGRLRIVDIAQGRVTTLAAPNDTPLVDVFAMTVAAGGVVTTQPAGRIILSDLRTGARRVLVDGDPALPRPGAVATFEGHVVVAPVDTGGLFRLEIPSSGRGLLERFADSDRLFALTAANRRLYGLRAEVRPALVRLPGNEPVPLPSVFGGEIDEGIEVRSFLNLPKNGPVALADGRDGSMLVVTHPGLHVILSVRDVDQGARRNGLDTYPREPDDFSYPKSKPPRVFRILLVGDSHVFHPMFPGFFERTGTVAKRLELFLNTHAALEGRDRSFEVLARLRISWLPILVWPATEVPPIVRDWNIDLVVLMLPPHSSTLEAYLNNPMAPDGLPSPVPDMEHLLLPPEKKLASNPAARLWSLAHERGFARISDGGNLNIAKSDAELAQIPEARAELLELYGRPLATLSERIRPAKLVVCLFDGGAREGLVNERQLYEEICRRRGIAFVDLLPAFAVLREAYYPVSQIDGYDHFTPGGMALLGELVAHELSARGFVP